MNGPDIRETDPEPFLYFRTIVTGSRYVKIPADASQGSDMIQERSLTGCFTNPETDKRMTDR